VLARIVELEEGRILIDNKDISKMKLSELRQRITFIPQDPSLFTGSLKFNLDPKDQNTDEKIVQLLKEADLDNVFTNLEGSVDLNF